MTSKTSFYLIIIGIIAAIVLGGLNYKKTQQLQQTITQQQQELTRLGDFLNPIIEEQQMMQALDSIQPEAGASAPTFSFEDQHGNMIGLTSFTTPKALLVFSSAQCHSCKDFYPHLQQYIDSKDPLDVAVIQIDSDKAGNIAMLKENGYNFRTLVGTNEIFNEYRVTSTPTTILIDTTTKTIIKSENLSTLEEILNFLKD